MKRLTTRILFGLGVLALFLLPIASFAGSVFDDVDDDNIFIGDITWMKDNDITRGCNPPLNTRYCPTYNVTREQMSAFMHRLAVNKVVDAKTAIDSDTVDGKHADELGSLTGSISGSTAYTAVVDTPEVLISMTGVDVPVNGGVITVDANASASIAPAGPTQVGLVWLEVDKGGACEGSKLAPGGSGFFFVKDTVTLFASTSALVTQEIAAGNHRIDLCIIGLAVGGPTQVETHMNATWSPNTSAAGVASAGSQTYQELLAPYKGMLDE